jgi:hypothetical protein
MVSSEDDSAEYRQVCASLSVLAGIAAGDAICGHVLNVRSRGESHRQAVDLLRTVRDAGPGVAALNKLVDIKDAAQYGTEPLSGDRARSAVRAASILVERMDAIVRR